MIPIDGENEKEFLNHVIIINFYYFSKNLFYFIRPEISTDETNFDWISWLVGMP